MYRSIEVRFARIRKSVCLRALTSTTLFFCLTLAAIAAELSGTITSEAGAPLAGITIRVAGTPLRATTDSVGKYSISQLSEGRRRLVLSYLGRYVQTQQVNVATGKNSLDFTLSLPPTIEEELVVSSTRTGDLTESNLSETLVRSIPANVTGELLRQVPGVDAVRRGPVGLDPVVRGLRETEVGAYLDGTRLFPGGPARMDSALSHLDPSAISRVQIVKGPYALTWGAGNLSAIRVDTRDIHRLAAGTHAGSLLAGYHSNVAGIQGAASVYGKSDRLSYWAHGVGRETSDFEDGDGNEIPGDLSSREIRAKLGFEPVEGSRFTLSAGYQEQRDIDYPGRLLTADFFDTSNLSLAWDWQPESSGNLQGINALIYHNEIDHGMDNDGKPTAVPNPNRIPPFALDVTVAAAVEVSGGRFALEFLPGKNLLEVGLDLYRANRDAVRTIARQENGAVLFVDKMWPNATITDLGLFARGVRPLGRMQASGTLRLDRVDAEAGDTSAFFQENAGTVTDATETNLSGAFTLASQVTENWLVSAGIGSAVRTADASERYSDRIPASKAQTSAEFMGNPQLEPERGTQLDLWIEGVYPRVSFNFNAFSRRIEDYITIEATSLPRRLPLSPPVVYRYINADASFYGAEASLQYRFDDQWQLQAGLGYLRGEDRELDEPAIGIAPLNGELRLSYAAPGGRLALQATLDAVTEQDRVALARGEQPTDSYLTLDCSALINLGKSITLNLGGLNLADEAYANHLNARNPFTGNRVPEPGRVLYADFRLQF